METRKVLANYLKDGLAPAEVMDSDGSVRLERPLLRLEDGVNLNLMAKARAVLPTAFADRLVNEYIAACGKTSDQELNAYIFEAPSAWEEKAVAFLESIIERLSVRSPLKDSRTTVTYFAETNTCRVTFVSQDNRFSEATVKSGDELWKLLRKAATDGIDFPAPSPVPYRIESPTEWLKTHRPTKVAMKKIYSGPQASPLKAGRAKKPSKSFEEIMKLDIKL